MRTKRFVKWVAVASTLVIGAPVTSFAQAPASAEDDNREVSNRWVVSYVGWSLDRHLNGEAEGLIYGTYIVRRWSGADWRMLNIQGIIISGPDSYVRFDTGVNLYDEGDRFLGLAVGLVPSWDLEHVFAAVYGGTPLRLASLELLAEGRFELHQRKGRRGVAALLTIGVPLLR